MYSSFKDNIWGADLTDMQLISKVKTGFRFLLCVIDIYSKYVLVLLMLFKIILKESNRRPNKIWVDKGSEFYNISFKK